MPDISMCADSACPLRAGCYRYLAAPNPYRQSWAWFKRGDDGTCNHHSPIEGWGGLRTVDQADADNNRPGAADG
ncbi:MAG: hypothetical protein CMH55_07640 [Myxococcales bacterium]|nr:hypothetical protein [Myxococcales bacterium]|tara:strand:- start:2980 stop:3201 length:222 start_codon:yes stop_codon:yes gene_type:complete